MFENKIVRKLKLREIDELNLVEAIDNETDFHQTILNIGYDWWNSNSNPNLIGYSDMIDYMDKEYGSIYGTLILLGKYNQQVCNGGHLQYFNNYYSRKDQDDYDQVLHIRMIKEFEEIIKELETKGIFKKFPIYDTVLNRVLNILKEYLELGIDTDKYVEEEVGYEDENGGFYFIEEEVENENFGEITDYLSLEKLNERYYLINTPFMEIMNEISKLCIILPEEEIEGIEEDPEEEIEEIEEDPEEWDDEMTISDRIDSLIDPEMNIFKIDRMFKEAYDLSNTKSESEYLIDQFIKNFDKEYLIIKKDK